MKTLKFKLIDQDIKQRIEIEDYNIGDTWPEQIELFFQFLQAQGFMITYSSFLETFGDMLPKYED